MRHLPASISLLALAACGDPPEPGSPAALAGELHALDIPAMAFSDDLRVMTAGQLSHEQLIRMPYFGFETVICLRGAGEDGTGWEEEVAARNGVRFVRLPIGADGVTRSHAERLAAAIDAATAGVVVYCEDSDRTGALLALAAHFVGGTSAEAALATGKQHGLRGREAAVRAELGLAR